jgi:hypothetical protein
MKLYKIILITLLFVKILGQNITCGEHGYYNNVTNGCICKECYISTNSEYCNYKQYSYTIAIQLQIVPTALFSLGYFYIEQYVGGTIFLVFIWLPLFFILIKLCCRCECKCTRDIKCMICCWSIVVIIIWIISCIIIANIKDGNNVILC